MRIVSVGLLLTLLTGCGSGKGKSNAVAVDESNVDARTELAATGWGTLTGRVTFAGTPPEPRDADVGNHPQKEFCCSKGLKDETWRVDPASKGVANVVVWLQAPEGKCFPVQPRDRRTFAERVEVDQPICAFQPRVVVLHPRVYDPRAGKLVPTDQQFRVLNSAPIPHAIAIKGSDRINPTQSSSLPAKPDGGKPLYFSPLNLQPDREPILLSCNLHPWMRAYAWAFDHPYAAVTDAEGRFMIRNAPSGVEVELRFWHEAGTLADATGKRMVTLPANGERRHDLILQPRE